MSEEDKQPYCDEYEAEKVVYNEQLKVYRNSPAYKKWLEAKMQGESCWSPPMWTLNLESPGYN